MVDALGLTLEMRRMDTVRKSDCISVVDALSVLKISRNTLNAYMGAVGVEPLKFRFDRKSYIKNSDLELLKQFVAETRGE